MSIDRPVKNNQLDTKMGSGAFGTPSSGHNVSNGLISSEGNPQNHRLWILGGGAHHPALASFPMHRGGA